MQEFRVETLIQAVAVSNVQTQEECTGRLLVMQEFRAKTLIQAVVVKCVRMQEECIMAL